mmetsp:Transcript_25699/g.52703  ORF Transcript_25699/g.52703 Transcript_25699/m.52703 type:complete len:213 (+) Transcript_25699:27-665(+)|eukprot:CAMPEP_0171925220 /NCGR_PEP_ID=MMETSP0993-20121228/23743_1 /TAXON_ID=483369 /ORGANISM="non described non described, Strain CCMP2098" /LENGTH=212 /DNA_ID=CAMNT_0012563725 /DNA_START=56 /DNA_END=694 /DNA_ORIENTATION=+
MASLLSTRQALLVNALTGAVYPLAHGENIVGRSSSRQQADDEKKLPLEISSLDGNISRHQATVAVANHSDGIHVTLQTHRTAKNPTKLCRGERFGSGKNSRVTLKSGEIMKLSQGDLIELDSLREQGSSYAWRLDIQGAVSSSKVVSSEAALSHFNLLKGNLSEGSKDRKRDESKADDNDAKSESSVEGALCHDESDDEELIAQLRASNSDE